MDRGWLRALARTFERWGTVLVMPRSAAVAASTDEGRYDELCLIVLYVLGSQMWSLLRATAGAVAVDNGIVMWLAALGQALVVPIVAAVLVDVVLGGARRHRRGMCLVPLVVCATLGHVGVQFGWWRPSPDWLPGAVGAGLAVALAWWIRPVVPPAASDEEARS